jgi:phage terminase small subunit
VNDQQRRFVAEYIVDFNATQAAIRAGYSEKTARQIGSFLLTKVDVKAAVQAAMVDFAEEKAVLKSRVVKELASIAFSNITDLYHKADGTDLVLADLKQLDRKKTTVIKELKIKRSSFSGDKGDSSTEEVTVKLYSKEKALELLGRHVGIVPEPTATGFGTGGNRNIEKMTFEEFCVNAGYPLPFDVQVEMMLFGIEQTLARMILGARGYGKTDYVVILGVAYKIYTDPNFTVLLVTKSKERNAAILREVADALYKVGVELEIDNATALRVKGLLGKDHSLSAATINSVTLRGRHPSLIIMDDPVTPEDSSEAVRRKAKAVYNECMKLKANLLLIGQPVHVFDLYQEVRTKIPTMEVPYGSIPELDADLEAQRIAGVDEATIQASYYLKVSSEGTVPFALINYTDEFPVGETIAFIDPAFGGEDYTAVAIFKAHFESVAIVGFAWKKSWEHCIDDIYAAFKRFNTKRYAFETNKTGDQPLDLLRTAMPGIGCVGIFSNTNKHSRIMAAGNFSHHMHLSKLSNKAFIDQTVRYEHNAKNDDAPDAIASGLAWVGLIRGKI